MKTGKSKELFQRAQELMPGGVNSPVRAFGSVGRTPLFIDRAKGSKIYDVDENEYIDYVCSWGPGILGHAYAEVIEAVIKACENGLTYGAPTKKEILLAELISEMMPSIEMVRLVNSGTEAVMSAIRVARGFTKRDMIIKFKGCYHGHSDGMLVKAGSAALTSAVPDSAGVPVSYTQNTLVASYNDEKSVQELYDRYGYKIAAIIVEPIAANMGVVLPKKGFLEFLRKISEEHDSLLIFDEVITGFRVAPGGASQVYNIKPDLITLGKIVGGGMPIGAYGGRRDIMRMVSPLGEVYQAGTLSGNPIATTAGITTLNVLKQNPQIYIDIENKTRKIAEAFQSPDIMKKVVVNQIGSLMSPFFTKEEVVDYESAIASDRNEYAAYFWYLLDRGIYVAPSQFEAMFISNAHTEQDINRTCEIIKAYFTHNI